MLGLTGYFLLCSFVFGGMYVEMGGVLLFLSLELTGYSSFLLFSLYLYVGVYLSGCLNGCVFAHEPSGVEGVFQGIWEGKEQGKEQGREHLLRI